jgi:hypothetical protein
LRASEVERADLQDETAKLRARMRDDKKRSAKVRACA